MFVRALLLVSSVIVLAACQTYDRIGHTANRDSGVAQMTTGGFGPSADAFADSDVKPAEEIASVKPAQDAKVAPVAAADCPKPSELSTAAVGQPCLTTEQFVASLKLTKKQQALALEGIKKARQAAH